MNSHSTTTEWNRANETTNETMRKARDEVTTAPTEAARERFNACVDPALDILRAQTQALMTALASDEGQRAMAPKSVAIRREAAERALEMTRTALVETNGDDVSDDARARIFTALVGALAIPRRGAYEGTCEEVMLTLRTFCERQGGDERAAAFQSECAAPMVGFTISTLLAIAHEEASAGALGSKSLRSDALLTLDRLIQFIGNADALAFFLPGIVSGLTKVLAAASGIRAQVGAGPGGTAAEGAEHALGAMSSILTIVMRDDLYDDDLIGSECETKSVETLQDALLELVSRSSRDQESAHHKRQTPESAQQTTVQQVEERSFRVKRDGEWLRNTSLRVETALLAIIPPFIINARASARLATATLAGQLIEHCSRGLGPKVRRKMLECLLTLSGDPWSQVAAPILENLHVLDDRGYVRADDLENVIRDGFEALLDALRQDSSFAIGYLQRLVIALKFTGPSRLKGILFLSPKLRQNLCLSVVQCLEITPRASSKERASKAVQLIDLGAAWDLTQKLPRQPTRLHYFSETSMYTAFATILRILGQAAVARTDPVTEPQIVPVVQFFLSALREDSESRRSDDVPKIAGAWQRNATAHVVALNELMQGAIIFDALDGAYLKQVCSLVLDEYVCSCVWELDALNPDNALLLCAVMEGLGVIGQGLGSDYIRNSRFLTSVLCPLLDKLGEDAVEVRDTAALVLSTLAVKGEYASAADKSPIGKLVVANGDYVVDMLSRHIRHLDQHPRASQLFAAVLRRTDAAKSMVRLLTEPIRSLLRTLAITSRSRYQAHTENFLLVTKEYCLAVSNEVEGMSAESRSIAEKVQKYHPDEPDSDDEQTEVFVEALSNILPEDIKSTRESCTERVRQLQSMVGSTLDIIHAIGGLLESRDAGTRSLSARTCALVLQSLSKAESAIKHEKHTLKVLKLYVGKGNIPFDLSSLLKDARVLPHVHDIWPHVVSSLRNRYQISIQPEPFEASLSLLQTMATVSGGDFIAKRMRAELWPLFARILEQGVRHVDLQPRSLDSLTIADSTDVDLVSSSEISIELSKNIKIQILHAFTSIASAESSKGALQDLVIPSIPIMIKLATSEGSREIQEAAKMVLHAFSNVNPDELWLQMMLLSSRSGLTPTILTPTWVEHGENRSRLPPVTEILPWCALSSEKRVTVEGRLAFDVLKSLAL